MTPGTPPGLPRQPFAVGARVRLVPGQGHRSLARMGRSDGAGTPGTILELHEHWAYVWLDRRARGPASMKDDVDGRQVWDLWFEVLEPLDDDDDNVAVE